VNPDDKAQQTGSANPAEEQAKRPRGWKRWIGGPSRDNQPPLESTSLPIKQLGIHACLHMLPTLLNSSGLPNGVVELLIEDLENPTRQLFDIHDGQIALIEPGAAVPWTSIAGPATAWTDALGPERNVGALRLAGDEQLARRVLAALPPHAS
jgi:hypothetical protein